jgi:hypothetical protein
MSRIAVTGNPLGTGTFTIASPNSNTDRTLNLPDAAGTIQVSGNPISGTTGTFTGLVDISAAGAGQIQFPATQNASANANTLDDYEEGTWTPSLEGSTTAGTTVYSGIRSGQYVKVGRQVTVTFRCSYSSATGTGNWQITGCPFPVMAADHVGSIMINGLDWSVTGSPVLYGSGGPNFLIFLSVDTLGWTVQLMTNQSVDVIATITYITTA